MNTVVKVSDELLICVCCFRPVEPGDLCICPKCLVCGARGDPECYERHGLVRTKAQAAEITSVRAALVRALENDPDVRRTS